ncbi:MAG: hypothetical protein RBT74_11990 [Tenuifilaceae bacterium]|nr:hypothetical protein [Tenuifilaceae bacterium]
MKRLYRIFGITFIVAQLLSIQAHGGRNYTTLSFTSKNLQIDSLGSSSPKSDRLPLTSVYVELGGRFTFSLNVDFRKEENFAICLGSAYWFDDQEYKQSLFVPHVMLYYLKGKTHSLELGGGMGTFLSTYHGLASIMLYGNIGYRYQRKRGLIFRAGFTPWISIPIENRSKFWITPWAGISVGYSF